MADVETVPDIADKKRQTPMIEHAACGKKWTGLNTSHCGRCHETFTGISAFSAHRVGDGNGDWHCSDPKDVGLVDAGRKYPCWREPVDESHAGWFKKLREKESRSDDTG